MGRANFMQYPATPFSAGHLRRARARFRRTLGVLAALPTLFMITSAAAADGGRVVALPTHAEARGGAQIDRALRDALASVDGVELAPQPAFDLEGAQLAIDCVDETPECLRQVAERSEAQILIAPSLARRGGGVELRLLYYDARTDERRFAARREAAKRATAALVAGVAPMVDELFRAREPALSDEAEPTPSEAADEEPDAVVEPNEVTEPGEPRLGDAPPRALPTAPLLLGGGGLLLVGGGLVVGALMASTERDYADKPVLTAADAEDADAARERGEQQALAASVLLGVGAAAVVAAGVWLSVELGSDERPVATLAPELGPDRAGLRIAGRWGAP